MLGESLEARRGKVVGRIRQVRKSYDVCVKDVLPDVANRGSEWSIADLLRHAGGSQYYKKLTARLINEDNPQIGGYDADAVLKLQIDRNFESIDEALGVAESVTKEQLTRAGTLRGKEFAVIDSLELWVDHLEEHLVQLRDEVRPREGLQ